MYLYMSLLINPLKLVYMLLHAFNCPGLRLVYDALQYLHMALDQDILLLLIIIRPHTHDTMGFLNALTRISNILFLDAFAISS